MVEGYWCHVVNATMSTLMVIIVQVVTDGFISLGKGFKFMAAVTFIL